MAIQFCEGFDLTTNDALFGWSNGAQVSFSASGGRFGGGRCVGTTAGVNANARYTRTIDTPGTKIGACFGWQASTVNSLGGTEPYNVVRFREGSTYHVGVRWPGNLSPLSVYMGGDTTTIGTLLATGTQQLLANTWYGIEVWVEISDTVGRVKVYIDGNPTPDIDFTGDTKNGGTGILSSLGGGHSTGNSGTVSFSTYWDDLVVYDDTGSVNNAAPLGDLRVVPSLPDGAGNTTQGTPLSSTNFSNMDETTMDSDTTYVEFSTVGHKDTYAMAAVGVSGTVLGVQNRVAVRKTDAGSRAAKPVLRYSGVEVDGTEEYQNLSYRYQYQFHNSKPGGGAWDVAAVDATEAGVKMTA